MSQLNYDEQGFLVGQKIDLTDVQDTLLDIHGELKNIGSLLTKRAFIDVGYSRSVSENNSRNNDKDGGSKLKLELSSSLSKKIEQASSDLSEISHKSTIQPNAKILKEFNTPKNRDEKGRFVGSGVVVPKPKQDKQTTGRDEKGRFVGSGVAIPKSKDSENSLNGRDSKGRFTGSDQSDSSKIGSALSKTGEKIKGAVSGVASAISGLSEGNEEASPDVKALGEVVSTVAPIGRGLKGVFTAVGDDSGLGRGQNRWYKRFFRMFDAKNRDDEKNTKRELQLLKNIEKKDLTDKKKGILGVLLPFLALLVSVLAGVLSKALGALGLKSAANFLDGLSKKSRAIVASPIPKRSKENKPNKDSGVLTGGKTGEAEKPKPKGRLGRLGGGVKNAFKRVPILGALLGAGMVANDIYDSETDPEKTRQQKNVSTSRAVGSGVGGLGGAVAGASIGAVIGSVVPVIGTVAGGLIGSVIGGLGGGKLGSILGDKFGEWVNKLDNEKVGDKIVRKWDVSTSAMSIMWGDFTQRASTRWNDFTDYLKGKWDAVTALASTVWSDISNYARISWDKVANGFDSVKSYAGKVWDNVKDNFASSADFITKIWTPIYGAFGAVLGFIKDSWVNVIDGFLSFIKDKLHIDLTGTFDTVKNKLNEWWNTAKDSVSKLTSGVKSIGDYFDDVGDRANKAADNIEKNRANNSIIKNDGSINSNGVPNWVSGSGNERLKGLKMRDSVENIAGGQVADHTADFAQIVNKELGDQLTYFSAFNDKYHKGTNSKHAKGNAFDFVIKGGEKDSAATEDKVKKLADAYGYKVSTLNEYKSKSGNWTGNHIHVSVDGRNSGNSGVIGGVKSAVSGVVSRFMPSDSVGLNTAYSPDAKGLKLGERNHNMGNLMYVGQANSRKDANSKFAVFNSDQDGMNAFYRQLQLYNGRGINTVGSIIRKYAPKNENNTAKYISDVSRSLGVSPDQRIDINDPVMAKRLMQAMVTIEQGRNRYSEQLYDNAIAKYQGKSVTPVADIDTSGAPSSDNGGLGSMSDLTGYLSQYNGMAVFQGALLKAIGNSSKNASASTSQATSIPEISTPKAQNIANISQQPTIKTPVASSNNGSKQGGSVDNISRNLSDNRLAHIVTGGYFRE